MRSTYCQNCHTEFQGDYCCRCGERRLDPEQRKLSILLSHLIESLWDIDGKFFRTIRYFLFKPGFLAFEHWRGVRKSYMKPISFFLIVNVIYFFFSPMTDFSLALSDQSLQPYSPWIQPIIDQYIATHNISFAQLAAAYDPLSGTVARSLIILSIPFFVPFLWLVNPNRKYYLIDHSVNALYIYSFILICPIVLRSFVDFLLWLNIDTASFAPSLLFLLLFCYYLYALFSQRFMYQDGWIACSLKSVLILVGIATSHFIYRFIQFWIVWWQIT